jgi:plastocyanin
MVPIRIALILVTCLIAACAPDGTNSSSGGAAAGTKHVVELNLTQNGPVSTQFGTAGGTKPPVLTVNVGDTIIFTNTDSFAHMSSSFAGRKFPAANPIPTSAFAQRGKTLSGGWSSAQLQPGSSSQVILADKVGTYLYGCFFHYTAPMRASIVAR